MPASVSGAWAHACARLGTSTELSDTAQLLTRLQSRNDIGELVAALFAVTGHGDDHEPDRAHGVNGSTNGEMQLSMQV